MKRPIRKHMFLGVEIVPLPRRPTRAVKIMAWGNTIALLANGKVAWGADVNRRFRYGEISTNHGRGLAEVMMRLGVIDRKTFDAYDKKAQQEFAKRHSADAARQLTDIAKRAGVTLNKTQRSKMEKFI